MSAAVASLECFGGPLDGERRSSQPHRLKHKEVCPYVEDHPDHPFPTAVYALVAHAKYGPIWQFEGMIA